MVVMSSAEKLMRERTQIRRTFSLIANKDALTITNCEMASLEEKSKKLANIDAAIHDLLLSAPDFSEEAFEKEYDQCEMYQLKWREIQNKCKKVENKNDAKYEEKRHLRLPKLEIRQFDDNPKNWLAFWAQFKKIHEDEVMNDEDKLQYLTQAMSIGSQAHQLVCSYPATPENYKTVIETLKSRYGREDTLIEIYVRELLNLVLGKNNISVDVLYDKVNVNLQILEFLGIAKGKYECMLTPLIESALPDRLLIEWSKIPLIGTSKLNQLLEFMRKEVEAEERCRLARAALGSGEMMPTAACLVNKEVKYKTPMHSTDKEGKELCYFCDRSHSTFECGKANSISLEERKEAIKKKGGCYICLKKGHMAKACKAYVKCISCAKRHYFILCPAVTQSKTGDQNKNEASNKENNAATASNFSSINKTILLQTLIVKLSGANQEMKVRALLDSGSQRSYVKAGLAELLGLKVIGSECLSHSLFGGVQDSTKIHRLIELQVSNLDSTYQMKLTALEHRVLCGDIPKVHNTNLIKNLKKQQIKLTDPEEDIKEIGILIGTDYLGSILQGNIVQLTDSLVAIPTKLGWTLQGPIQGVNNTTFNAHFVIQENSIEFLWNIESLGIKDPYEKEQLSETEILKNFNDNISVNADGRYEVELLWKENPKLETNYDQAYRRLLSTTKKLESTGKLLDYNEVFQEWKREGIIEMVENKTDEGHYLPHHAVIKLESITTKIRPVFDASCKDKNKNSLNTCMEKGINLIEVIPKLLTLFRAGTYGVISDIRKAFLQIAVTVPDRKYLKLLWWQDPNTKKEIVTYQHARVPFGVACSPFLLAATINYHLEKHAETYPETAKKLKESFYVDNCVTSFDSESEVKRFRTEATELMEKGKFELRCWMSNGNQNKEKETGSSTSSVSVLGIQWNRDSDEIWCNLTIKNVPTEITKRELLSVTQQVFDPIGICSPTALIPKLIMQRAWVVSAGWEERIPAELEKEYRDWLSMTEYINQCKIPRRLSQAPLHECKTELHIFSDASQDAYAGCVFLRTIYEGKVTVRLVMAKSRVAPIKRRMTLPRLELMGALIASRLYREVETSGLLASCKNYKLYCWTDSAVVLAWLKREETMWKTFVSNRVSEICTNTNRDSWNHLPGIYNPADLPSRGCNAKTLQESQWWLGPQWLYLEEKEWPRSCITKIENREEEIIASEQKKITAAHVEISTEVFSNSLLYFSKYTKIVRLVARILRMSPRVRREYDMTRHIGYEEYINAETTLIKLIQKESYKENKMEKKLITIEDEGILKVKTRLQCSGEEEEFIRPTLLPGTNTIVQRMVEEKHREMKHAGTQTMMATLRNTYWITGVRKLVKNTVAQCIICKRYKSKHYVIPEPPLPADRTTTTACFEVTGIDLAGPLFLKNNQKCWIILFTCAVYRAIHLELTESLSTSSFLMALRRFIARRGRPRIIYTDNGTNFVGAANLLREINWQDVEDATKIVWKFSVPAAPWWGGWWERLIRVVKDMLRRILGKSVVDWIELQTILCDCETVINSRPLTYVEMGSIKPLTPMMFLQTLPTSETQDLDHIDEKELRVRFKYLQQLREDFRKRFKHEYLSLLISKGKEGKRREPQVGELVLIDTDTSRIHWPLGIIREVFVGKDGFTRVARVQTSTGTKVRPYQRLYPLELSTATQDWFDIVPASDAVPQQCQQQQISGDDSVIPIPISSASTTRSGRPIKLPVRFME